MRSGCRSTSAISLTMVKSRLLASSFSICSLNLNFSKIARAVGEKPLMYETRLGAMFSASPSNFLKVKGLVL